jgi:hypothetical protein
VLAGESLHGIRRDFNARGVQPPGHRAREWDLTAIRRALLNPAYVGKRVHNGKIVGDAIWPSILDESDWLAIRDRLTDPDRRTTGRQGQLRHLVSHIARCGVCGKRVVARNNRALGVYACSDYHVSRSRGTWRGWPEREAGWENAADGVDDLVTCYVIERLSAPDALDLFAPTEDEDGWRAARDEADELRRRLDGFVQAAADGEVTPGALATIEAKLLPKIAAAEERAHPQEVPAAVIELAEAPDPAKVWRELPVAQRRQITAALLEVKLHPAGRGNRRSFDPQTVEIVWRGGRCLRRSTGRSTIQLATCRACRSGDSP